jgi:hypothetical protein
VGARSITSPIRSPLPPNATSIDVAHPHKREKSFPTAFSLRTTENSTSSSQTPLAMGDLQSKLNSLIKGAGTGIFLHSPPLNASPEMKAWGTIDTSLGTCSCTSAQRDDDCLLPTRHG